MSSKLSADEVAMVIKARQILKARGISPNEDVKTICEIAGISRKTGYKRAEKLMESSDVRHQGLREQLEQLKTEHEDLERKLDDVNFENEGRKIAWEIHEVDKLLAEKKSTTAKVKNKKR